MLSKQNIKFISSLRYSKYRLKYNCFVVEGPHLVDEFINSDYKIHSIFSTDKGFTYNQNENVTFITKAELKRISYLKNPSNVLAVVYRKKTHFDIDQFVHHEQIVLLDSISDPGNMGSMIRTADWFGLQSLYLSKECVDVYNPKVVQSTMGSLSRVSIHIIDLKILIKKMKQQGIICCGATLLGESIYKLKIKNNYAIIFGNESHGISLEIKKLLDKEILIPTKNKQIDSLNVAVSFGIILSEFR
ncbi:MAG: RNA methyltransferase [Flavobacteriales bacterium]|nr:RNA methyltransferase [Flavobacteriales bacterium]|tara:strand:- start:6257 stop:6991 length:735 start_codon:yes stop_codon:yes gene_type:complete